MCCGSAHLPRTYGVCDQNIQKMMIRGADFREIMEMVERKCSPNVIGLFAVISGGLWMRRNSVLH